MRTVTFIFLLATAWVLAAGDAGAQGPIKIGFISPLTGAIAAAGKDMYSGCELYRQESGWQMAGRSRSSWRTTRATRPSPSPRPASSPRTTRST